MRARYRIKIATYHVRSVKVAKWRLLTDTMGVSCCVSYTSTASTVATAYTMRYGRAKTGLGPGVKVESISVGLGEDVGREDSMGEGMVGGGGSIAECVEGFDESTESGRGGIASSADEVSIVMLAVVLGVVRRV